MIKRVEVKGSVVTIESDYGIFTKDLEERIIQVELSGRRDNITIRLNRKNKNGVKGCDINEEGETIEEWRPQKPDIFFFSIEYREEKRFIIGKVEIQGRLIRIECGEDIFREEFDEEIKEFIIWGGNRIIVQVSTLCGERKDNPENNRNVYCLNEKAEILWQIQDPDTYRPGLPQSDSPFTGISISEDGKLKAYNWDSHIYDVDIETGRLLYAKWTK